MKKIVQYSEIPNIPEDPEKIKLYGYDPDRELAYMELEEESFKKEPFAIPGYIYKDYQMIPIPRIKKRIGSKLYDTTTSECLGEIEGGILFQKRSRDREFFAVMDDGTIRPLDVYDPDDRLLMETGHLPADALDDPKPAYADRIRVDPETHARIAAAAKARGVSMAAIVRDLSQTL